MSNPSARFLSQHGQDVPGSCVMVTQEGTRPLLVEVQALVDTAHGNPRRLTVGLDAQRLAMLLAVLHRHAGIVCFDQDVFVNAVGGVKITEPAADLAVILSITSSLKNKALPAKLVVFGEVGLAGEIRPAPRVPSKQVKANTWPLTNLRASSAFIIPATAGAIIANAVAAPRTKRASMQLLQRYKSAGARLGCGSPHW